MRRSICLLCLVLFGGCVAAQADPLVTVTINGVYHNEDDTFSTPEPSSFILLGTGLVGLFQIGRSRMRGARRAS